MEYRAISLHQPWASLIALGIKQYETRSWETKYRGKLLICSAKKIYNPSEIVSLARQETFLDRVEQVFDLDERFNKFSTERLDFHTKKYLPLGKVLCVVDLTDIFLMKFESIFTFAGDKKIDRKELLCGDWNAGRYAWELQNLKPLPDPIPVKGKQGLWIPDQSLIQEIEKQILLPA